MFRLTTALEQHLYIFKLFIVFRAIEIQSIGFSAKRVVTNTFHTQKDKAMIT